jgi:hypothetical protein
MGVAASYQAGAFGMWRKAWFKADVTQLVSRASGRSQGRLLKKERWKRRFLAQSIGDRQPNSHERRGLLNVTKSTRKINL